jgi:ubiquinone/menaquinone biosynthesis C-methylase UbiE
MCSTFPLSASLGQEKSVRPGINAPFRDPEVKVDEWVKRFEGESREVYERRNAIIAGLKLKPGMTVADVGAGTGLFTRLFADKVTKTGTVYAVDISPKLLDYVRTSAEKFELPQVKTVLGKDTSAELPQGSVDLVFICDTYHHFEFPEKMMKSIHQALKPGGRVVIIDFVREPGKSSDWVLEHVRAGQKIVEQEVTACGFRKVEEVEDVLKENYFVIFEKQASPRDGGVGSSQAK